MEGFKRLVGKASLIAGEAIYLLLVKTSVSVISPS